MRTSSGRVLFFYAGTRFCGASCGRCHGALMRIHLVLSNLSLQPFESFASLPLLLLNLLLVLAISSLLTVLERKGLAASQRRLGPSQHGWFGFLQIVADGIKLIYKDPSILGLFRSSTSVSDSTFVDYLFPPICPFFGPTFSSFFGGLISAYTFPYPSSSLLFSYSKD